MVLSEICGNWRFQIKLPEKTRFKDLLCELIRAHGKKLEPYLFEEGKNKPASHIMFMVNGRNIKFLNQENTILEDNDQVMILLPAGGG